ncbi:hypothetical protein JMJ77_0001237 [Colletotrichum scovillei]|uniref:Uncharacterized protein n=1 Tax=Colletotrichum scovillei TaxID=1209932 RepID=A0A9P7RAV8_9PEZI|nr:hypothetical protein JMJ77_0001237 [Colletotrichum scovillei]KAG7072464.1 hypothetical protein JMJ76_0005314 [Colletotrichum scovillei]KAG7080832.1 hypothetical protein JMJ78_0007917 [Colletotrichum scovillei]
MTANSNKSIVHGGDSPPGRKDTDTEEILRLGRERLRLFSGDSEYPNPMLPHMTNTPKASTKRHYTDKRNRIMSIISDLDQ